MRHHDDYEYWAVEEQQQPSRSREPHWPYILIALVIVGLWAVRYFL